MNIELEENKNEIEENINLDNKISTNNELNVEEESFFNTTFGKIVESGIEIGIKAIFPSFIEDEIINIKNVIINDGFKEAITESLDVCKDVGKSFKGIVTGEFENLEQLDMAVKKGGILDTISSGIDTSLKIAEKSNLLDKNISKVIKASKNILIDSVSSKIGEGVKEQVKNIEKLQEHSDKWMSAYKNQDFDKMKKSYTFVKKYAEKVMPIEDLINKANEIENIQNLIEKNGGNFEIEESKLELAKIL